MTQSAGIEGTAILALEEEAEVLPSDLIERAKRYVDSPGISVLRAAQALHEANVVSALHDPTEGGIATAVREMAIAAGAGVIIWRQTVPVSSETAALTAHFGIDPLGLLSSGALLAAVPKERMNAAEAALAAIGVPFAWIGKLTEPSAGFRLRDDATEEPLPEFAVDELARVLAEGA
jgi:hydrogenase maturation factor